MNSEADHIIGLYQRHAQDWDKDRGRSLFERPWLERFLKLVPPGGSILDIGCGSSEPIARFLIEQGSAEAALLFTSGPAYGEAIGEYRDEPLYHGSLDGAAYRELLEHSGFAIVSHVVEDVTCGNHTIWLTQLR